MLDHSCLHPEWRHRLQFWVLTYLPKYVEQNSLLFGQTSPETKCPGGSGGNESSGAEVIGSPAVCAPNHRYPKREPQEASLCCKHLGDSLCSFLSFNLPISDADKSQWLILWYRSIYLRVLSMWFDKGSYNSKHIFMNRNRKQIFAARISETHFVFFFLLIYLWCG